MGTRIEKDTMGALEVPEAALYGAQTARALINFPISGQGIGRRMVAALGRIKAAAAEVNGALGRLEPKIVEAISSAAAGVVRGDHDDQFTVDVFQTGSGTSSNMNANEVIATLATRRLGGGTGGEGRVHPNDHVNMGQSSNDVFPTAIHLAALEGIEGLLLPALTGLREALAGKAAAFDRIVKIGRTHLQDATPIRLGQEFSGFAAQVDLGIRHLTETAEHLRELPIGGTAVGTGINTTADFGARMAAALGVATGLRLVEAGNHFEAQGARDAAVRASGALKSIAVSLIKIANDIRWLGSGPRLGLGELRLPAVQPGSSIMPGKVNPVMAEALVQVAAQVIGNDAAITAGGLFSQLQLNTMQPLIARNLLEQIDLLGRGVEAFTERLVKGLEADEERIAGLVEESLSLATALAPTLGYERAAALAKQAAAEGRTVREVAVAEGVLPPAELERLLDPERQTRPE